MRDDEAGRTLPSHRDRRVGRWQRILILHIPMKAKKNRRRGLVSLARFYLRRANESFFRRMDKNVFRETCRASVKDDPSWVETKTESAESHFLTVNKLPPVTKNCRRRNEEQEKNTQDRYHQLSGRLEAHRSLSSTYSMMRATTS